MRRKPVKIYRSTKLLSLWMRVILTVFLLTASWSFAAKTERADEVPKAISSEPGSDKNIHGNENEEDRVAKATESLHVTGRPQDVDITEWRLEVKGDKVGIPLALPYEALQNMEMVKKNLVLVCPGFFRDIADWEGVPLPTILEMAQVSEDYKRVDFHSLDGYISSLSREEIEEHFVFLALKVNGVVLPREHGFPVRLVAEDITGGKWAKWITAIEVQ
jgi:DMSO/TMAO reductase YedYZ molybdopterin-dependent catalytic subunit